MSRPFDELETLPEEAFDGGLLLVALVGEGMVTRELPATGELVIGRSAEADVRVDHESLSRKHAVLSVKASVLAIRDLESANGTKVRGKRIDAGVDVPLRVGELVELGGVALVVRPRKKTGTRAPAGEVVRVDPAMTALYDAVERVAKSSVAVLIIGETGAGKESVAEAVHARSRRANGPLVKVNCAALTESLLESELFGHVRGAFTNAVKDKQGLFEAAKDGTLFLDEVGEMPMATQVKLLRVLEEKVVRPVGATTSIPVDVRIVAATNRELEAEVEAGRVRADLFYRLNGVTLRVPPLRERVADIEPLAAYFLERACLEMGRIDAPRFDAGAIAALRTHRWPGNVRELRNAVERAVALQVSN
ncbi:MAG TPA: sigma 54-interacting transcriptional regulator, partial [Myxococcota bacterium]|nr:sigma 54-interacting transcriptional regulator [Myxococcota bacterium]